MRPLILSLTLLSLAVAPVAAQSPFAGRWSLRYPAGMRMENGVATIIPGSGTLTLEIKGDSLIGQLTPDPLPDGTVRPPTRLAGTASGNSATFTNRRAAMVNDGTGERQITVIQTWRLTVTGDSLSGTLERRDEGGELPPAPPAEVTGSRQRP